MANHTTLAHRMFWNWDHSTNWCLNARGQQHDGIGNHYTKTPETFEIDFRRMVDFAARHHIDAVGTVALLRNCHGGADSARRLCGYAQEHGVRLYLIAGLYSYGGLYFEGNHPLSLQRFLSENPECMGVNYAGKPTIIGEMRQHTKEELCACPSNRIYHEYILDALDALFDYVPELGGIQIEAGDSSQGLCMCEKCRERRHALQGDPGRRLHPFYFSDMATIYPDAVNVIRSRSQDAWAICEMYRHFLYNPVFTQPDNPAMKAITSMPKSTFLQWSDIQFDWAPWEQNPDSMPESFRGYQNIMRCHYGTQWRNGRATLSLEEIRRQCELSYKAGMTAVSMFGECSPYHTNAEFNYLAMEYFADHPLNSILDFAEDVMKPRLGNKQSYAQAYLDFGNADKNPEQIPQALQQISTILHDITDPKARRRWFWLAEFLNRADFEYQLRKSEDS